MTETIKAYAASVTRNGWIKMLDVTIEVLPEQVDALFALSDRPSLKLDMTEEELVIK